MLFFIKKEIRKILGFTVERILSNCRDDNKERYK